MDNLTAGNPLAHRVRVYYEGDETLEQGMPLCYNFNTTNNWFGGSVSDGVVTASGTTAEGSQNEGKYIRVTNPVITGETDHTHTTATSIITPGTTADFDNIEVGMFVNVTGTNLTGGVAKEFEVTAVVKSTDSGTEGMTLKMTAAEIAKATDTGNVTVELNNFVFFAGFVAKGGWCGKTGPRALDIYVPNGAIVPVRAYVDCNDKDALYLVSGANYVNKTAIGGGLVAVAAEDYNRATTAGLILARAVPPVPMIGADLTDVSTQATFTAPGTGDVDWTSATASTAAVSFLVFTSQDEAKTFVQVVANIQARLKALGLIN